MTKFVESIVEEAALEWLEELGYEIRGGAELLDSGERSGPSIVILQDRLTFSLRRINRNLPAAAIAEAIRKLTSIDAVLPVDRNHRFHHAIVNGVEVEYQKSDGTIGYDRVKIVSEVIDENDWLAVNQFTVVENRHHRRPDVVIFLNGLAIALIELKNAADEDADIEGAFRQIQTYKEEIPSIFDANEICVISDGHLARVGTITSDFERFMPWRTIGGDDLAPKGEPQLEVALKGVFEKERLLELIRHFIAFEADAEKTLKKLAGYHQFHAVRKAVAATIEAACVRGDRRAGVIWHTQGSGKSLTMLFYAGRLILEPRMENPTIVVITDRNDLDDQLFGTFSRCSEVLRQNPEQAESREDLRELLKRASGGVIFTTIQKFAGEDESAGGAESSLASSEHSPENEELRVADGPSPLAPFPAARGEGNESALTQRTNVIVIADEAHRSQYGLEAKFREKTGKLTYGFAKYLRDALPNATFIGFTGTPVEFGDARSTRRVFGDYIDIYDIQRAVEDKATVPIYYESRLAKLDLSEAERPTLDEEFEEATVGEAEERKAKLKSKWAALERIVGSEKRLGLIASDLVKHWEERLGVMNGKAMIVCMSRRICVDLYNEIVQLRPEWLHKDDDKGVLKIVMTGSADEGPEYAKHARNKPRREALAKRFKDASSDFRIVIVRDMWLTGFDVPPLHTMYVDKPMRGHGLMQAIARVNRVFRDKPGGTIVDYLGLTDNLRKAMARYTEGGGEGETAIDIDEAVAEMKRRYEIVCDMFHRLDRSEWTSGKASAQMKLITRGAELILQQENGKERLLDAVLNLTKAFALAIPTDEALAIRDDVGFFQAVRAALMKTERSERKPQGTLDVAIRQILARAIVSDQIIDIFQAAGLSRPDISILSPQFLEEVRELPQKNLAIELLKKLLNDEVKRCSRKNIVQSRQFSEMLEQRLREYQNRALTTAEIIERLIELAKEMNAAAARGEQLGLTEIGRASCRERV
jgi:type I site-specific deoxyribonuclease, HsdR family/type I site-specific deoxyribonuclease, HsdR family